jgi:cobalt transporter subunit CbtA
MLVRVLLAAIAAGLIGGVFATAAQAVRVTPLIIAAETYESSGGAAEGSAAHSHDNAAAHDHGAADQANSDAGHDHGAAGHDHGGGWMPEDGFERTLFTLLSNVIVGVGFALIVTAAILVTNQAISFQTGLLWGLGGFITFVLAPNLGLPPVLPGTVTADLNERQLWWLATVACTGGGLAIFAFRRHLAWMAVGVALILAPHVIGAPRPEVADSNVPASLAVEFVIASIATAFVYWLFLGGLLGFLLNKAIAREQGKAA